MGYGAPIPADYGPAVGQGTPAQSSQQRIGLITFAIVGLLGVLGAVLTLTLWINMESAIHRAEEICDRVSGEYARSCQQAMKSRVPSIPAVLVMCMFVIFGANIAATAGAVMLFLKRQLGQFLILGGGIVMLVLSIGCEARYGETGRLTYDLVAGVVIAVVGGLLLVPAFRVLLGLPPTLTGGRRPVAGPWPYGPPQPPQPGAPGPPPQHW